MRDEHVKARARSRPRTAFAQPEGSAWQAAGAAGEDAACKMMDELSPLFLPPNDPRLCIAIALGAIVQLGQLVHTTNRPESMAALEPWVLAYLRGALRGEDHPVHDNGKPFRRSDA